MRNMCYNISEKRKITTRIVKSFQIIVEVETDAQVNFAAGKTNEKVGRLRKKEEICLRRTRFSRNVTTQAKRRSFAEGKGGLTMILQRSVLCDYKKIV